MTVWAPERIAGFARDAGFPPDALGPAVALAMATSGGQDAYQWLGSGGAGADDRGLWGIDARAIWATVGEDLFDPVVNAAFAHNLYDGAGGAFTWSAVYRSGAWLRWAETGSEAASRAVTAGRLGTTRNVPFYGAGMGRVDEARRLALRASRGVRDGVR